MAECFFVTLDKASMKSSLDERNNFDQVGVEFLDGDASMKSSLDERNNFTRATLRNRNITASMKSSLDERNNSAPDRPSGTRALERQYESRVPSFWYSTTVILSSFSNLRLSSVRADAGILSDPNRSLPDGSPELGRRILSSQPFDTFGWCATDIPKIDYCNAVFTLVNYVPNHRHQMNTLRGV